MPTPRDPALGCQGEGKNTEIVKGKEPRSRLGRVLEAANLATQSPLHLAYIPEPLEVTGADAGPTTSTQTGSGGSDPIQTCVYIIIPFLLTWNIWGEWLT